MVRLLINGLEADIETSDELGVRIIKRAPATDIGETKADYTLNMTLPATSRNNELLRWTGKYNKAASYASQPVLDSRIEVDGVPVMSGRLFITKREPDVYKATLVGDNVSWAVAIKGKTLQNVQAPLVQYSGVRGSNVNPVPGDEGGNVALSEIWNKTEVEAEWCMPLVAYGNFPAYLDPGDFYPDPVPSNPLIGGGISVADSKGLTAGALLVNTEEFNLDFTWFKPAWFVRPLLRRILSDAGYSAGGTFFDDPRVPANLALPYVGKGEGAWNWGLLGSWIVRHTGVLKYVVQSSGLALGGLGQFYDPADPGGVGLYAWCPITPGFFYSRIRDYGNGASRLEYSRPNAPWGQFQRSALWACQKAGTYTLRYSCTVTLAGWAYDPGFPQSAPGRNQAAFLLRRMDSPQTLGASGPVTLADRTDIDDGGWVTNGGTSDPDVLAVNSVVGIPLPNGTGTQSPQTVNLEYTGYFEKGQAVMPMIWADADTTSGFPNWQFSIAANSEFSVTSAEDRLLNPALFLPDMDQSEFVKGLIDLFGLVVTADIGTRTVSFDFADDFYQPTSYALDWTGKANIEAMTTEPADVPQAYAFEWQVEKDDLLVTTEDRRVSYERVSAVPTADGRETIELPFAFTANRTYTVWDGFTRRGTIPLGCIHSRDAINATLGDLADGSEKVVFDYEPRILQLATHNGLFWVENTQFTSVPYLTASAGLGWVTGEDMGQYASGYQDRIERLERGYVAEIEVLLTPYDLATLNWRRPVHIGGQAYYISEIDAYNPAAPRPVLVKLIRA